MATACTVWDEGIKVGTGTIAAGDATILSWSKESGFWPDVFRKNVQVQITGAGAWQGRTFNARILEDNTTELEMNVTCPFVGA